MKIARRDIIAAIEGHGNTKYVTRWPFRKYALTVKRLKNGWRILIKKLRSGEWPSKYQDASLWRKA